MFVGAIFTPTLVAVPDPLVGVLVNGMFNKFAVAPDAGASETSVNLLISPVANVEVLDWAPEVVVVIPPVPDEILIPPAAFEALSTNAFDAA